MTGHISTALVTRFGCRITTLIGGAFCVVSLITSSFVENISVLFITYSFLFCLGCSCTFSSGLVVISQYFKEKKSLATGVLTAGHGGGVLVMGPTLEALTSSVGWQSSFRIMAGISFLLCSLAITFDPNVETDEEKLSNCIENEEREHSKEERDDKVITKIKNVFDTSVWKEPPFVALILCACVVEFGHFVPQIHLVSVDRNMLYLSLLFVCFLLVL